MKGLKKVDKTLDTLEKKLKKFSGFGNSLNFGIGNFTVDQKKLERVLGNSLDLASNRVTFDINRFAVNQAALNQTVGLAMARAGMVNPIRPNVLPQHTPRTPTSHQPRPSTREAAVTGAVAGGVGRTRGMPSLFGPAIALGLGGYGLNSLNRRNQEVVAAQLQTQAVITGNGGTAEQGEESFNWLRKQANRVGFNYLESSGDFNVLTSNLLGSGGTIAQAQNIFKGFAEYGRVNKLSPARQKLVFNALSQIAGKDKLQAEELTKQLGNSLPGAKDIFAQAWQQKTGGKLTGSEAIIALEAAMKKGLVRGDILNTAADIASAKSQPGLAKASQASQAEQARYQNAISDLAIVASDAGVEEGFARIFRTLTAGLSESNDLVKTLAEGFNDATKWADDLLLFPQSFVRALEGKDSLVADWLGKDNVNQLRQDWTDIKQIFTDISALKFDFLPTLKATSAEIASIMNAIAEFQRWKSGNLPTEKTEYGSIEQIDPFGTGGYTSPKGIFNAILNNTGANLSNAKIRGKAVYEDMTSPFYQNPELFDANKDFNLDYYRNLSAMQQDPQGQGIGDAVRLAQEEDALTARLKEGLSRRPEDSPFSALNRFDPVESGLGLYQDNIQTPADLVAQSRDAALAQSSVVNNNNVTNNFDVSINVDASLAGIEVEAQANAMAQAFSESLTGAFEQVQVNYPTTR